jgi:hypothetical protein
MMRHCEEDTKQCMKNGISTPEFCDAMLILAYQYFEQYEPLIFRDLAKLFAKQLLKLKEGQQWDVDFEDRTDYHSF